MLPRLIPSSRACRANGRRCERSIIVLRSATDPAGRAHVTKNHSPASVCRSWRAASSRRLQVPPIQRYYQRQKHRPAPSRSWVRQVVNWFASTSYRCANSDSALSPFTAANATFALHAGLWFRRGRLLSCHAARWPPPGRKSTYHPVQLCQMTSFYHT